MKVTKMEKGTKIYWVSMWGPAPSLNDPITFNEGNGITFNEVEVSSSFYS